MNIKTLYDNLEPLLSIQLKMADRMNLDEIHISICRAREILKQLRELQKSFPVNQQKTLNKYLDVKFAHMV